MISSISGLGSLNQSYMVLMRQQMFTKIDSNGDGKHDKDELAAMVANGPKGAPGVDDILSKFDTDRDGAISENEFEAAAPPEQQMQGPPRMMGGMGGMGGMSSADFLEQMFSSTDTNGDGVHDEEELAAMAANGPKGAPGVHEILEKFDTDGDGVISGAEFDAGHSQENELAETSSFDDKLLEALLEALDSEDATTESATDEPDTSTTIVHMLSAAIKSYTRSGVSSYTQSEITSMISSELYA
jgi:Ca2+-binding EF-hand superfamily protein